MGFDAQLEFAECSLAKKKTKNKQNEQTKNHYLLGTTKRAVQPQDQNKMNQNKVSNPTNDKGAFRDKETSACFLLSFP